MQLHSLALSLAFTVASIWPSARAADGDPAPRLEINDMFESGAQWELLVQSLKAIQEMDEDDTFSYFQLAGIHGVPPIPWDNVTQVPGGNPSRGFCTHSQINFIIWHRPYLALLERAIISQAQRIASHYVGSDNDEYRLAAQSLRLPYWDWATNATLPRAVTAPTLAINLPNVGTTNIRNPFYSYSFRNFPFGRYPGMTGDVSGYSESKRCADVNSGISNFTECQVDLAQRAGALREAVYSVFTQSKTYEVMATQRSAGFTFETPHNEIHNLVGCTSVAGRNGHMKYTDWSSFDPVFFLHHANLDRLLAMWQAIYYNNTMFTQPFEGAAVFGTPEGLVYPDTPLKPFRDSTGAFYTSNSARDVHTFAYTYPELAAASAGSSGSGSVLTSKSQVAAALVRRVNTLYDPSLTSSVAAIKALTSTTSLTHKRRRSLRTRQSPVVPATASGGLAGTDYAIEIAVDRAELPLILQMPCSVDIYLGNGAAARRVGSVALLDMPSVGVAYGNVPLRRTLLELMYAIAASSSPGEDGNGTGGAGTGEGAVGASPDVLKLESELEGGSRDAVVEALKASLRVVVRGGDGTSVSPLLIRSLAVNVLAKRFVPRQSDDEFPLYGEVSRVPVLVMPLEDYQ